MDSTPKPSTPGPGPDPDQPARPPAADGDATIRTPDGDVTLRSPGPAPAGNSVASGPTQPGVVRAWNATVRGQDRQDTEATVRLSGRPDARTVLFSNTARSLLSKLVKPVLAATAVALLVGAAGYVYLLNSKLTLETANRQQALAALDQAATAAVAMREELTQARQEMEESRQQLGKLAGLSDTVAMQQLDIERLGAQLEEKEKELVALYKSASPKDATLAMLQSASVQALPLSGVDDAKSARGLILYDAARGRAFLYAFNLPALPRGKVYQLWAGGTKPVSAGTFTVDTGRKARHLVRNLPARSRITKFTVSVEPDGGSPQPTGAIYLRGSL